MAQESIHSLTGSEVAGSPIPQRIGRYWVIQEIAQGGMGRVYLARSDSMGDVRKLVALKVIHPHLATDDQFVRMFLDEARIASRIAHPNVCAVFDVGEDRGIYYIAMELLVGVPLHRVMRAISKTDDARMDAMYPALCARIVADACEGLHAAHELVDDDGTPLGLVHRDVSPQNIFVTFSGTVSVVDFGVARAAGRLSQTTTGSLKGKIGYMAPETIERRAIDRRADIWGIGVVLWELLTGRRLFRAENEAQTLFAVLSEPIPPPSAVRDGVPKSIDAIVLRALERDVGRRYQTARELARDLHRFIVGHTGGDPVGAAEVESWLSSLFPDEKQKWKEAVERARTARVEEERQPALPLHPSSDENSRSNSIPQSAVRSHAGPSRSPCR
ncbi:MAG: serine/threonine-protein kinase [Sandaracinaceae bacterium]|nr:serine/threonine-protein kinase [Sandaracinaceae bacterium]